MARRPFAIVIFLCLSGLLAGDDKPATDPIKEALLTAKEKYDGEMGRFRDSVKDYFEKREAAARKNGDKKLVDQIKAERDAFAATDELPRTAPDTLRQKAAAARSALEGAHKVAIKEYTRVKKDVEAGAVEKELELFRKGGGPGGRKALFNGKDLTGWVVDTGNARQWEVEDGAISGTAKTTKERSYLMTTADYADFVLSLDFKFASDGVSAGVVARGIPGEKGVGVRAEEITHPTIKLTDVSKPREPLGTTFWLKDSELTLPSGKAEVRPKDWNRLVVTVVGRKCKAEVNGKVVLELTGRDPKAGEYVYGLAREKGRIALQANTGTIRFRDIQVRETIRAGGK